MCVHLVRVSVELQETVGTASFVVEVSDVANDQSVLHFVIASRSENDWS